MRIAHVLLTSRFAGSERYAVELASAQAARGHAVAIVLRAAGCADRPDAIAARVSAGVQVLRVPDWLPAWHAARALARWRPDVAHAHLSAGCRALHGTRGRMLRVATLHIRYKPRQHAALDGLVAIAPWQLEAIPEGLRARTVQLDNWTHPRRVDVNARMRLRGELGIAPDAFLFGTLGRVEASKGHDTLVRAFARAAIPGARLAIVGQGRAWASVRRLAGADVLMPGFTADPAPWYAAFDGFVSAARSEPFGLVLLEAMEAGLPVVATASEGARHLAPRLGRPLVPVDDVDALAAALRMVAGAGQVRIGYDMEAFRLEPRLDAFEAFYRRTASACGLPLAD